MTTIEQIAEHLTASGLRFGRPDDERIDIGFNGDNTSYEAIITARGYLISVVAPNVALLPDDRLDEAIRLANLLNARRMAYGCFWVEPARRRLAFEVAISAPEGPSLVQVWMAMSALNAIDDFFPAFARVLWGGASAEEALSPPNPERRDEDPPFDLAV